MKTPFLIVTTLLGTSDAFSTSSALSKRPSSALKDAAILDPLIQGGMSDQMLMAAGGATAAVAAGLAAMFGSKNGAAATATNGEAAAPEPEPIDVSIPYNAPAMLAFSETKLPQSKFEEFESLYLAKTVADVTVKKMARDVVAMEEVAAKLAKDLESLSA